ncbi:MAG: type II secretion system protein [bacterium]
MIKSTKLFASKKGFTLLEILLVVGIIAILAGIVILAINPSKQLADTRNAQRRSDVITILNAVYQYSIDHNGSIPATVITTFASSTDCNVHDSGREIDNGTGSLVNLYTSLVGATSTYLVAIPRDPMATSSVSGYGSGYAIGKIAGGRIMVCAPLAENGVTISVTR